MHCSERQWGLVSVSKIDQFWKVTGRKSEDKGQSKNIERQDRQTKKPTKNKEFLNIKRSLITKKKNDKKMPIKG